MAWLLEKKTFEVIIHSFVCDAPARAFINGIKCHSGYSSCKKCVINGKYEGKGIFPTTNDPLRTDEDFNLMKDENHHVVPCPLNPLNVGFVSQFGLDYMHMACLGVMRRLLLYWIRLRNDLYCVGWDVNTTLLYWKGPVGPLSVRLGKKSIDKISEHIAVFACHSPVQFARKARSLDDVSKWKATEFRNFYSTVAHLYLRVLCLMFYTGTSCCCL